MLGDLNYICVQYRMDMNEAKKCMAQEKNMKNKYETKMKRDRSGKYLLIDFIFGKYL